MELIKDKEKAFREYLLAVVKNRRYVKVQYFTDLHEFITTMAVAKSLYKSGDGESMLLGSGEMIPVDRIVRINEQVAPGYQEIMDFTCDC